jgi:hypothetical protein
MMTGHEPEIGRSGTAASGGGEPVWKSKKRTYPQQPIAILHERRFVVVSAGLVLLTVLSPMRPLLTVNVVSGVTVREAGRRQGARW